LDDNWGDIDINSRFELEYDGMVDGVCTWNYSEFLDFLVCPDLCTSTDPAWLFITADISAAGVWTVSAWIIVGVCEIGLFLYSSNNTFKCSANTVTIESDNGACPATPSLSWNSIDTSNAQAVVSWNTGDLVTPDHWTATFSGEIVACDNAATHHATACPQDVPVEAAILQLKDPSGIVIYNTSGGARCAWASPCFQVRGYPTWYLRTGLTLTADGAETTWKVWASIRYLGHPHDEGVVGGIPGLKYNCMSDRDEHYFFLGEGTTGELECDSPPAINNDLDCDVAHTCDPVSPDNCVPCGSGGSVSLVGG